jgi:ligand-binding sensor domain-containing protein/putative methionine-R-sulfoxide reductase with GAF domain
VVEVNDEFVPVSQIYPFAKELDDASSFHGSFIFDERRNCFWIGTTNGFYCLDLAQKKLFSPANNPGSLPIFSKDIVNSIALDEKGNLWFGNTTKRALCYFDFSAKHITQIRQINNNAAWELDGGCNTLFFDKEGRLWISTWLYSAFIRYPDGRFEEIPYKGNVPYSIGYGFFSDAHQDAYGNIWLATINGLSKLETGGFLENIIQVPSFKFFLTTDFANVNTVYVDEESNWWLGKMDGLIKYNVITKRFERFIISTSNLRLNEISAIDPIGGELWCATSGGIYMFNIKTGRFRKFDRFPDEKTSSGHISWLLPDQNGFVWISVWGEGVFRYNPVNNECTPFSDNKGSWGDFEAKHSLSAFEMGDGKIWIDSRKEGIRIFNPATQKFSRPASALLNAVSVTSMTEDGEKNIWVSTVNNGLLKCNATGQIKDSITRKNGLPLNNFSHLSSDAYGRLWTVSRENLICILPDTKEITKVDIPVNFSFNDHWNSLLKKGKFLYATMLDNVVIINTEKYQRLPKQATPLISAFHVFGKELPVQHGADVQLKYKQNFFSFDFASPFHRESLSMQYAYKLEGFDKDWVYNGRKLTATYTNVPDGAYKFLVKTTDGAGKWMINATSVNIFIRSPFWKQWWFVSLITMLLAIGVYWLVQMNKKRRQKHAVDETIDYFANSVYGSNSITEICWDIARNCIAQLKFEDCVVYLLDEKRNVLIQKAAYGPKNPKEHEIVNPIEIEVGKGIVGAAAATCKPVMVRDTTKDARYILDDQQRLSELAVPVVHEGRTIGVIDSEHSRKNFFTEEHLKALSTIAAISANKIAEAKAAEAARESEMQLLEIKKMLAESQLMALRAQMNPHFVFNCLNSIQECIVTRKYGEASLYLNKFSKLFRSVLNNSGRTLISLAEEIEVLELYLALEHMRFEKSFEYAVHVQEDMEVDEILIPSMLLQPYVENALWHGLMHKEKDRELTIYFKKLNDDVFECVVEDNGIGRKKAFELKEKQSKTRRHASRGMNICRDRIELLQKQEQHAALKIVDKYDDGGNAKGTKVVIELSAFLE